MPLLPREEDLYPADLLARPEVSVDGDSHWWALYTMARREKDLMRRLRPLEVPFYCPLVEKKSRARSGRVRASYLPLFSCYVFIHGTEMQRHAAMTTNCVSRWCSVPRAAEIVHDLCQIHRLIETGMPVTVEEMLQPGQHVRVRSGPLQGLEGTVLHRDNRARLVVAIDFLQQGASVSIDDFLVEKI